MNRNHNQRLGSRATSIPRAYKGAGISCSKASFSPPLTLTTVFLFQTYTFFAAATAASSASFRFKHYHYHHHQYEVLCSCARERHCYRQRCRPWRPFAVCRACYLCCRWQAGRLCHRHHWRRKRCLRDPIQRCAAEDVAY